MKQNTLPAQFRAFFDLYLGGMTIQALLIFNELAEIGRANEERLKMPHLEWAGAQTKNLIRSSNHLIRMWVKDVCDKHVYDPSEDWEERIYRRKWQAPMFLIMKPSRYAPYNAVTVWERNDPETSSQLLEVFAEHYVLHLEGNVKRAAGEAALALAKQPQPVQTNATSDDPKLQTPTSEGATQLSDPAIRRKARKLVTEAMYVKWQKEYRRLKKSRPGKPDLWYSQHISWLPMAEDRSAETIRRHMTK